MLLTAQGKTAPSRALQGILRLAPAGRSEQNISFVMDNLRT